MKRCSKCSEDKPESAFYSKGRGALESCCKRCRIVQNRASAAKRSRCCRECGTKLHPKADGDVCGFCASEPPSTYEPSGCEPPDAAENRARVAAEQVAPPTWRKD